MRRSVRRDLFFSDVSQRGEPPFLVSTVPNASGAMDLLKARPRGFAKPVRVVQAFEGGNAPTWRGSTSDFPQSGGRARCDADRRTRPRFRLCRPAESLEGPANRNSGDETSAD